MASWRRSRGVHLRGKAGEGLTFKRVDLGKSRRKKFRLRNVVPG